VGSWCQDLQHFVLQILKSFRPSQRNSKLALTLVHFLVDGPLLSIVEPVVRGESKSILSRWQHLKALHYQFRARWKDGYLIELHKRNKWQFLTENLRGGNVVVIKNDNLPSNEWRLGRMDSVFPGADRNVRVVKVKNCASHNPSTVTIIRSLPSV